MNIGVLVDTEGKTSSLEQDGMLKIFCQRDARWQLQRERTYAISQIDTPDRMRGYLSQVGDWLKDCQHFVVRRIRGVHLANLDNYRLSFWEIDGFPESCFDYILKSQNEGMLPAQNPEPVLPVEQEPGHYFVDLTEVMNHTTTLNSRQVLEPFLRANPFQRLEIRCLHMPKWLESELPVLHLRAEVQEGPGKDEVKVLLFPSYTLT